jgi:hypothetical protein
MASLDEWLFGLGLLVVLSLLSRPGTQRALARLARGIGLWVAARLVRTAELDPDEAELWQFERRRKLCADLRRVEHLLVTDARMSATRQLGNRLAYRQLVDDLRQTPEVFPALAPFASFDSWDESADLLGAARHIKAGYAARDPQVEILEFGWGRRRD